jgi:hypothetical protein
MEHGPFTLFYDCDGNLVLRASKADSSASGGSGVAAGRRLSGIVAGYQYALGHI